ncbi:MAG TPA: XdhC/CoxI family protein [Candidatus Ozemobacteraceae bacterium]|nr:XdhC/CoxI family protein [Candidatus Ozemobacteraceae bacterium]
MSHEIWSELQEALEAREPFVFCVVTERTGSSPGKPSQKMLVYDDGSTCGTVGGGVNEERVRQKAMELFTSGGSTIMTFELNNPIDGKEPVCGGSMRVYLELMCRQPRLVIFGGGHIGRVLAKLASIAGYRVALADERPAYASPDTLPEVAELLCCPYSEAVTKARIGKDDAVVIVTPGHVHDVEVLRAMLGTPAAYIGMIGSQRKVEGIRRLLLEEGFVSERVNQVFAPIGINLGGETPEEIAVGILAQLVAFNNGQIMKFEAKKRTNVPCPA